MTDAHLHHTVNKLSCEAFPAGSEGVGAEVERAQTLQLFSAKYPYATGSWDQMDPPLEQRLEDTLKIAGKSTDHRWPPPTAWECAG